MNTMQTRDTKAMNPNQMLSPYWDGIAMMPYTNVQMMKMMEIEIKIVFPLLLMYAYLLVNNKIKILIKY